ncbi:MAG: PDZ domain-containing protein [Planctomycetia bacterium]|nr:PDZ domain-containing protein [Planctomycetia bacterium]
MSLAQSISRKVLLAGVAVASIAIAQAVAHAERPQRAEGRRGEQPQTQQRDNHPQQNDKDNDTDRPARTTPPQTDKGRTVTNGADRAKARDTDAKRDAARDTTKDAPRDNARDAARDGNKTRDAERATDRANVQHRGGNNFGASVQVGDRDRIRFSDVSRDSVAYRAGIRQGDVIVSIGGNRVNSRGDFDRYLYRRGVHRLPIIILRDGVEQTYYVDSSDYYTDDRGAGGSAWLGVDLDPRYDGEAVIAGVRNDGPASRAGIRAGDRVLRFNGYRVDGADHLIQLVSRNNPGQQVDIEILSGRNTHTVTATLGEH